MKSLVLHLLLLFPIIGFSQVGIGTTDPTATLDVNGNFRIRTTTSNTRQTASKDSILVVDALGNTQRTTSKNIIESHLKSFIKGGFVSGSPASVSLSIAANSYSTIPFNTIEFDTNSEFNTTTYTYTAKQSGIYAVYVAIRTNPSLLSLGSDFGVAVFKNGVLSSRESYSNIQVTLVGNVTPPNRSVQTLLQLNTGDTISFRAFSGGLINAGILSNGDESFFTIQQVR